MPKKKGRHDKATQRLVQGLQSQDVTSESAAQISKEYELKRKLPTARKGEMANKRMGSKDARREKGCKPREDCLKPYGAALSRQRLETNGFNPIITDMSVKDVIEAWKKLVIKKLARPSFDEYINIANSDWETKRRPRFVMKGFPFVRTPFRSIMKTKAGGRKSRQQNKVPRGKTLLNLLQSIDVGPLVLQYISASGYTSVRNLALSNKKYCKTIVLNTTTWNFVAGELNNTGYSGVFVAQCHQYAIGEMTRMRGSIFPKHRALPQWCRAAYATEHDLLDIIRSAHHLIMHQPGGRPGRKAETCVRLSDIDKLPHILRRDISFGTLMSFAKFTNMKGLKCISQFVGRESWELFRPQVVFSATRLETMLRQILQQHKTIQVLNLQQIPLLDRRLLAIILRACPNLVMLGVYDCELIHFGDLICLLDLIFEINEERRASSLPNIQAIDFYPRYYDSTAYENDNTAYGITSSKQPLEVVQKGFYTVLMKAFLKVEAMGLEALFDRQNALRSWLLRVPNPPLSVLCFLDGLHRYNTLCKNGQKRKSAKHKALYDILKPVRLGLEHGIDHDWPNWYKHSMGRRLHFCSSCGYEMLPQFFEEHTLLQDWSSSICSGCNLQRMLEHEPSDKFRQKFDVLSSLFPNWSGSVFNKDSPVRKSLEGLIKLATTNNTLDLLPVGMIDAEGNFHRSNAREELARHNKVPQDSVQNLPLLHDLLNGETSAARWDEFFRLCKHIDVDDRVTGRIEQERVEDYERRGEDAPKVNNRSYSWLGSENSIPSHNFTTAADFYINGLEVKGW